MTRSKNLIAGTREPTVISLSLSESDDWLRQVATIHGQACFARPWLGRHTAVSNCVQATMLCMANCMADQLTPQACTLYEQVYLPQPAYGGLPLLMLMDRGSIIQPAIMKLWDAPQDPRQIAVFHRVLQYFEQMVSVRRQADVQARRLRVAPSNS